MSPDQRDLRDLFAAVGAEERAAADPLDVTALLGRAHRRRAVRGTAYSAVGLGAAAAIALGAVSADGLWRDDDPPVPPATETATPRPAPPRTTPSATPTPTPSETAWTPSWDLCGMPAEDFFARDTAWAMPATMDSWWLETAWPWDTSVPADQPFPLRLDIVGGSELDLGPADARLVEVVAVIADDAFPTGEVAAVAATPLDAVGHGRTDGEGGLALDAGDVRLVSCAASPLTGGDGSTDTPLPLGEYYVVAQTDTAWPGGQTLTTVSTVGFLGEVTAWNPPEPTNPLDEWTIRETRGDGAQPVPLDSPVRVPTGHRGHSDPDVMPDVENLCGASATPWPPAWLSNMGAINYLKPPPPTGIANRFSVSATGFREGADLFVRVTTTNTGPDVSDAWIASPGVTIVKDGRIVGWRHLWNNAYAPATWGTGQTVQLELPLGQVMCSLTQNGEPWPAGTYEVYVQEALDVLPQAGYATRWAYDADGGPFPFTLD